MCTTGSLFLLGKPRRKASNNPRAHAHEQPYEQPRATSRSHELDHEPRARARARKNTQAVGPERTQKSTQHTHTHTHTHTHSSCVCVCEREREKEARWHWHQGTGPTNRAHEPADRLLAALRSQKSEDNNKVFRFSLRPCTKYRICSSTVLQLSVSEGVVRKLLFLRLRAPSIGTPSANLAV
jgi:hypothetical protein